MTALQYKLPPQMDEFLHCTSCHNYLSVPPIILLTATRQYKCGRCCINEGKKVKYYRDVAYEYLANCFVFPCRFKQYGCKNQTPFGQVKSHEDGCPYGKMQCPMKKCDGLVSRVIVDEFTEHFQADHQSQELKLKSHQEGGKKKEKVKPTKKKTTKTKTTRKSVEFKITQCEELLYFWIGDEFYLLDVNKQAADGTAAVKIRLKSYSFSGVRMTRKKFNVELVGDDGIEFEDEIVDLHGDEPTEESSGISFDYCDDGYDCLLILEMIETNIKTDADKKCNNKCSHRSTYEHNVALVREISGKYQYAVPSSIISTAILTCTKCNKYLSSRPTVIAPKNKLECGRCNDQDSDKLKLRPLAYESLASTIVFPCSFATYGCTKRVHSIALRHHENSDCKFSSVTCPLTGCTNKTKSMVGHFKHNHAQILVNLDSFKFSHKMWGLSPAIKNNEAFLVDVQFKGMSGNGKCQFALTHVNRAAGPRVSYKMQSKDSKVEKKGSIGQYFPKNGKQINASIVVLQPDEIVMRDFEIIIDP